MKLDAPKRTDKYWIIFLVVFMFILIVLASSLNSGKKNNSSEPVASETQTQTQEQSEVQTQVASENEPTTQEQPQSETEEYPDYYDLSESDYKAQCTEMYHDDIFFNDSDLEGKLVKVNLFLEEPYTFNAKSIIDTLTLDFIKKNSAQKDYFKCGVQREPNSMSYVGGQLELYFTDKSDLKCQDYTTGQHVTVYGQIVGYNMGKNTWKGYAQCELLARYIEVN